MSTVERIIHAHVEEDRFTLDVPSAVQIERFHRTTNQVSFGRFKNPSGDFGAGSSIRVSAFVMVLDDQPNMLWDAGEGRFQRDNARAGDNFLYLADRPTYVCHEQSCDFVILHLEPAYLYHCAQESIAPDRIEMLGQGCLRDPLLSGVLTTFHQACEQNRTLDSLYCESLVTALCFHTLRNYTTLRPSLADPIERGLGKVLLGQALDYINDHLDTDVGLVEIAAAVHLSPHYFSRLFKQSTGQTPHQYVIARRIEKAKSLLLRGRMTVSEVAQAVGFYDHAHFIRYFKRYTGVTPRNFRR